MSKLTMPQERKFGWVLKPTSSTFFGIHQRPNGQFCVVLNHALLRGVSSEMIYWWFRHFQNMHVTLDDVQGYQGKKVSAYLLWHPSDHIKASLVNKQGPNFTAEAGDKIHIQEAMQYKKYNMKYPVDKKLTVFYCGPDGWAMGLKLPYFGEAMVLRIHFKDVYSENRLLGAHYHYEVVMGVTGNGLASKFITKKAAAGVGPEFFQAWHLHNTIEVGVFENFLPALFAQRDNIQDLHYATSMAPELPDPSTQTGFNKAFFEARMQGYRNASSPYEFQQYASSGLLK